ncbi:hypothetical protein BH10PSE2_BH10PSE2_15090 [soil metagenome]
MDSPMTARTPAPKRFTALAAAGLIAALAGPSWAQSDAATALLGAPQPQAGATASLEARGETYSRAPDAEQDPSEVDLTRRLNAEVAAQDALADAQERADQAQHAADVAEYKDASADVAAENDRRGIDADINAQSRAEYDVDQQVRYDRAMADWRATVAACQRGERARCEAGKRPAMQEPVG